MGSRRNLQLYRGERIAQRQTHHPLHRSGSGSGSVAESIPFTAHNKQGSCPPKGNPKTIGFWRKPPKRRLWRMKRGGFEEVSRFSRHNVAGNRLTRWCVLLPTFPAGGKSGPPEAVPYKRKAPVGTKRKPARRERIPTTSLRTGLGMTGLAYERIFQRPNKACAFLCQSVLHGRMAAVPAKRKNSACFLSPGHI